MRDKFDKLIEEHEGSLKKDGKTFNILGYIKLALIVLLGIIAYFFFSKDMPLELLLALAANLATLIGVWIFHDRLYDKIDFSKGIIAINKRHLDRLSGQWTAFEDAGEELANSEHPYARDLDVVGPKSLFQFLNTTHTGFGRRALARDLLAAPYSKGQLLERQSAVSELSGEFELSNRMEYAFSKIGLANSSQELVKGLKEDSRFIKSKWIKLLLMCVPIITTLFTGSVIIFSLKSLYFAAMTLVTLQLVTWVVGLPKTQGYLKAINRLPYKLNHYVTVIETLKGAEFTSEKLREIQGRLGTSDLSAAMAMKELDRILNRISARNNGLVCFILNVLLLWDYGCAFMFEEWKGKYAKVSEGWFLALGEFESLLCFSNLPHLCRSTCMPTFADTEKTIVGLEMGHPLLPNEVRVNNDLSYKDSIFIISGSNMSGKTTFLRTVGINLVLAGAGGFVCAKEMSFSPMRIMTSMRLSDDLNEGISTFYAELKRIRKIVKSVKADTNLIFFIDEIFRGTNSVDRMLGAKAVISKLDESGAVGFVTTHDLGLCELAAQSARIKNYSFSETYENKRILFDYKMRPGKSTSTNAKYLMEMAGIL